MTYELDETYSGYFQFQPVIKWDCDEPEFQQGGNIVLKGWLFQYRCLSPVN